MSLTITYIILISIAFVQNMIFTLNSRARQSGNLTRSFFTSILSNGVWFLMTFVVALPAITDIINGETASYHTYLLGLSYALASALGGVLMQAVNLGRINIKGLTEIGKNKVGSYK